MSLASRVSWRRSRRNAIASFEYDRDATFRCVHRLVRRSLARRRASGSGRVSLLVIGTGSLGVSWPSSARLGAVAKGSLVCCCMGLILNLNYLPHGAGGVCDVQMLRLAQ